MTRIQIQTMIDASIAKAMTAAITTAKASIAQAVRKAAGDDAPPPEMLSWGNRTVKPSKAEVAALKGERAELGMACTDIEAVVFAASAKAKKVFGTTGYDVQQAAQRLTSSTATPARRTLGDTVASVMRSGA